MIPVEGHKNLFRDPETGAILNNDSKGYAQYNCKKTRSADQKAELINLTPEQLAPRDERRFRGRPF